MRLKWLMCAMWVAVSLTAMAGAKEKPKAAADLGLDLSETSSVQLTVVLPPTYKTTVKPKGGGAFVGLGAAKVVEKFDSQALTILVSALSDELPGKVVSAEAVLKAVEGEKLTPDKMRTAEGRARLARATNATWVVGFDAEKPTLRARLYDVLGDAIGQEVLASTVTGMNAAGARDVAKTLAKELVALTGVKAVAVGAPSNTTTEPSTGGGGRQVDIDGPPPDTEPDVAAEVAVHPSPWPESKAARIRVVVAVGAGGSSRWSNVAGTASDGLAQVSGATTVAGLGAYALIAPLQFLRSTAEKAYSDAFIDAHYRRGFMVARGATGDVSGSRCPIIDDELQVRANYRHALGSGYWPSLGLGVGYAMDRTIYQCNLPLASAEYSGIDAQFRVRQPLFRDILHLDVAVGPRFLLGSASGIPRFSLAGEAWLEAKPAGPLFVRAGARAVRAQIDVGQTLKTLDVRVFFAGELGVFF